MCRPEDLNYVYRSQPPFPLYPLPFRGCGPPKLDKNGGPIAKLGCSGLEIGAFSSSCKSVKSVQFCPTCPTNPVWLDLTDLHSARQKVRILYNGRPFPQKLPLPTGIWTRCKTRFLRPIGAHIPNGISIGSAVSAQMTAECPCTLQWDAPSPPPLKIAPSHGGIQTPSNTWFPGPTRVLKPNGISIGSAVFAGLTNVTDRQTNRQTTLYSVGNNRPHLRT